MMLAEWMKRGDGRDRYNTTVARQVDDFRDLIRLNYVSEPRDSALWRGVAASHSQVMQDRLARWQDHIPCAADFVRFSAGLGYPGLAHDQEQLYVPMMDGLGVLNRKAAQDAMAAKPKARDLARATHSGLVRDHTRAAALCLPHCAWRQSLSVWLAA